MDGGDEMRSGIDAEREVVRAYGYKLLSVLLAEPPTRQTMDLAASAETDEILSYMLGIDDLEPYRSQIALWSKLDESGKASWLVRQEGVFNRLFVGPGHLVAPPWESVYLSEDGLLFQEETLAVRNAYRRAGLVVPERGREADDHIAFELDYMYYEATGNGETVGEARKEQRAFLHDHLLAWLPRFAERIAEAEGAEFYAALGHVLLAFVTADAALLDGEPGVAA